MARVPRRSTDDGNNRKRHAARSLFILSLPRSLSSHVHKMCRDALDLQSPSWTSDGEVMNFDRSVLVFGRGPGGLKYVTAQHDGVFTSAKEYLSHVVQPNGFVYKDVVQPFIVTQWLREHENMPVLKIVPNIAHVASSMLNKKWFYPAGAADRGDGLAESMISGLVRAACALESVPGEVVLYDELIFDFEPLRRALGRLYPERRIGPLHTSPDFRTYRDEVLQRRTQKDFETLQHLERAVRDVSGTR